MHGLWMNGMEMALLRRRVARCGFDIYQFRYPSLRKSPRENAIALNTFLQTVPAEVIHLVAHSLGGIIVLHLFDAFPQQKPGRVVMISTPIRGSGIAKQLYRSPLWRRFLGRSIEGGLLGDAPRWRSDRELGMLAGTKGLGMGLVVTRGKLEKPNDGTVALSSTCSSGLKAHKAVPYSHIGILFASPVARAVCRFLQHGSFD